MDEVLDKKVDSVTVYFGDYIQEGTDAEAHERVAAIKSVHVVPDYADKAALNKVVRLIDLARRESKGQHDINRVEFIHRPGDSVQREYRGAVLYRNAPSSPPKPYIHVLSALLGYYGSGPLFSRGIMTHLGVPGPLFDAMNEKLLGIRSSGESYVALLTRVGGEWAYSIAQP